jgi:hypothetical protein
MAVDVTSDTVIRTILDLMHPSNSFPEGWFVAPDRVSGVRQAAAKGAAD